MCTREPGFYYYTRKVIIKLRLVEVTRHEVGNSEFKRPFVLVVLLPFKYLIYPGQNDDAFIVELSILSCLIRYIKNYVYFFSLL